MFPSESLRILFISINFSLVVCSEDRMRALGFIFLIGGILVRLLSPMTFPLSWILIGLGGLIVIISFLTKRK